ncbi:hypothetical protein ACIGHN_11910 [Acidovorax sp. NPDC077693]|uniref:hypothetical protein n=1 Tax=unclassified Acidovorax TaxID=2684926 RepID=UPI0037C60A84
MKSIGLSMAKSKWLFLDVDSSLSQINAALSLAKFDLEIGRGFEPLSRSTKALNYRFIEKTIEIERVADPFGEVNEIQTVRYAMTRFEIHRRLSSPGSYLLEIENPPRTVRSMIGALAAALGHITVYEVEWSVLDFYFRIKHESPRAKIVKLKASKIPISDSSAMKVEISSVKDAFADYLHKFPGSEGRIDKIRVDRPFMDVAGFLEVGANGLCIFDDEVGDRVKGMILSIYV